MADVLLLSYFAMRRWLSVTSRRLGIDDRGEGVISAAIAVLIVAFLGALMWVGFKELWLDAEANTKAKVGEIGQ